MFKWLGWAKWALRVVATSILLSFLCIWTTGYIVNSYMESVVKELDLPLEVKPFALSGVWGKLWGADSPEKQAGAETSPPTPGTKEAVGATPTPSPQGTQAVDEDEPGAGQPSETTGAEASAAPTPSEDAGAGTLEPGESIPVTGEAGEADGLQPLTDEERQVLYATVVSKLDASQLQLLSEALDGNATPEKLNQLKAMLQSALTASEYAQMMEVLQGVPDEGTVATTE